MQPATLSVEANAGRYPGMERYSRVTLLSGCGMAYGTLTHAHRVAAAAQYLLAAHRKHEDGCACCTELETRYGASQAVIEQ